MRTIEYPNVIRLTREVAQPLGYAIGVHGSQLRDLDLIAVAWRAKAAPPTTLVRAVIVAVNGKLKGALRSPVLKPHGRLAWSIFLDERRYIDLSVIPPGLRYGPPK